MLATLDGQADAAEVRAGLDRRTLASQIYNQLEQRILSGEMRPGTRLSEEGLAETFGVSRAPVREALTALLRTGLTERCGPRDRIITIPTANLISQKYDLWWIVDVGRTYLASLEATTAQCDDLARLVKMMQQAVEVNDLPCYRAVAEIFHVNIRQGCPNPYLTELGASCDVHLRWFEALYDHNPEMSFDIVEEHRRILAAYTARNFPELSETIRMHMLRQRDRILSLFAIMNCSASAAGIMGA